MSKLEADYLVIGGGAMGMAFTDVLMTETDATVVIVDKHDRPGGHWNDAYPFVRLHQPSAFYGVNSRTLGNNTIDQTGLNKGLFELATGSEVIAYFDQVMNQQFLASGRVQYFPMSEYEGNNTFRSLTTGERQTVTVNKKTVDATYMNVTVPSVTTPSYEIDSGVSCFPLNQLPKMASAESDYVVIGAGKTGMDACLWLLSRGTDPDRITWIMPRDSWMLDRANIQPGDLAEATVTAFANQAKAAIEASSIEDLFLRLEADGVLIRLDKNVLPTMYRCATVTQAELQELRRIKNVIRMGRVKRLATGQIELDQGDLTTTGSTLHIDCSADGLERRPETAVFAGDQVTLQSVRTCQQVFSAAFIGYIEASMSDESVKNDLCTPVPHPDDHIDWLKTTLGNAINGFKWSQHAQLQRWLAASRLDGFSQMRAGDEVPADPTEGLDVMAMFTKLTGFINEAEQSQESSD